MRVKKAVKYYMFLFIILSFSTTFLNAKNSDNIFSKEFTVNPNTKYKLSFKAKVIGLDSNKLNPIDDNEKLPSWEIKILDSKGRLPFEGYLKNSWQCCFSNDLYDYQQTFYTPATACKLQIIFHNGLGKKSLVVENIKLEKITNDNILINSDFSGGKYDYSGWSELNRAQLIEEKGVIKLNIKAGGYALTDPVPISPGKYIFKGMPNVPEMFFYDADMMRIDLIKRIRTRTFTTPANVAYLQFFFHEGDIGKFSLKKITKEIK